MKTLFCALFASILLFSPEISLAGEKKYTGTLSGVECAGCKRTIAKAFAKIEGVQTIRIIKNKDGSTHRIEVITDGSNSISKAQASKAVSSGEHYKILSWSGS